MRRTSLLLTLPVLLAIGGFTGCSDKDSPTDPGSTTTVQPATGSAYYYKTSALDSLGNTIEGSEGVDTVQVLMTGMSYAGKTGVTLFYDKGNDDSTYVTYDASGDVYMARTEDDGSVSWLRVPFATSQTIDSTREGGDSTGHYVQHYKATPMGSEDFTVGSTKFTARKVHIDYSVTVTGTVEVQVTGKEDYSFIPAIGFLAKDDLQVDQQGVFGFSSHTLSTLTGYTLK